MDPLKGSQATGPQENSSKTEMQLDRSPSINEGKWFVLFCFVL